MKAFRIIDSSSGSQVNIVIANDFSTAEETYKKEYPNNIITNIVLVSDYVLIQKEINAIRG